MVRQATNNKPQNSTSSWLLSIVLHVLVITALLITTSKTISNQLEDAPPAKIGSSLDDIQLQEDQELEELSLPQAPAYSSNIMPQQDLSGMSLSSIKPITAVQNHNSLKNSSSLPSSAATTKSIFFGTSGEGERICYIVDISGSMIMAIDYIKAELIKSVSRLTPEKYFQIIFYANEEPLIFSPEALTRASYHNRKKAAEFINAIDVQPVTPGTESWRPVLKSLRCCFDSVTFDRKSPNLIYLFTDGDFEYTIINPALSAMQKSRKDPAIINVLLCGSMDNERYLIQLAESYRGEYKFMTDDQLVNPTINNK